jgi:hypothetical protein
MKRIVLFVATLATSAWAGTLPNAGDEHVMRFGPLASAVFEVNAFYEDPYVPWGSPREKSETRWGGGVGVWGQYDRTWIGFGMRLGATVLDASRTLTFLDWENDYYFYLLKGRFRPFIMPLLGFRYLVKVEHHFPEEEGGAFSAPLALYLGVRWNAENSPFYTTISSGYEYGVGSAYLRGGRVMLRSHCYFGLTDTVALLAGIELGWGDFGSFEETGWRGRLDVGPSWAF